MSALPCRDPSTAHTNPAPAARGALLHVHQTCASPQTSGTPEKRRVWSVLYRVNTGITARLVSINHRLYLAKAAVSELITQIYLKVKGVFNVELHEELTSRSLSVGDGSRRL